MELHFVFLCALCVWFFYLSLLAACENIPTIVILFDFLQQTLMFPMNEKKRRKPNQNQIIHLIHFEVTRECKSFFASLTRLLGNQRSFCSNVPSLCHIPCIRLRFCISFSRNTASFYAKQNKPYQMNYHYFTVWFFWLLQFTVLIYFSLCALRMGFVHLLFFITAHSDILTRVSTLAHILSIMTFRGIPCHTKQCSAWMPMCAHRCT